MYIQLISIHGLIRHEDPEVGRDADTGGQVRYVLDLAETLAKTEGVRHVDLFTRRIRDKRVSKDYARDIEQIGPNCRIVRLPCGGGRYIRKELLWPHLDEFVDRMIAFTRSEGGRPDVVHGHYADAGYVAKEIAATFGVPLVFSGHSLGRNKLAFLTEVGWDEDRVDREYNIRTRIKVEEEICAEANLIVCSTAYERDALFGRYRNAKLPTYEVIPPGLDLRRFFPYYNYDLPGSEVDEVYKQARMRMQRELNRFYFQQDKPLILALCRPEQRKNIGLLVEAYGKDRELQALANLAVFAGIRKDISDKSEDEQKVLTDMLLMMDRYDLYGRMAIPKRHDPRYEVPELYRLAATLRGAFVSATFLETFGLTFVESSACGLPFIGSNQGGAVDIVSNCENGVLVDLREEGALNQAIKNVLTDPVQWDRLSTNGVNCVREHYSWEHHCQSYVKALATVLAGTERNEYAPAGGDEAPGQRFSAVEKLFISDIDDTLTGDDEALMRLKTLLERSRDKLAWGVATGRWLESAEELLASYGMEDVDVMICSVGTEIYYGPNRMPDKGWRSHIAALWRPDRIREVLEGLPFLTVQKGEGTQREFKLSYDFVDVEISEALPIVHDALISAGLRYKAIASHGAYLDILPYRASKGKALRYLSTKWSIPLSHIITAGNSENDREMLVGATSAIVVGNAEETLESIRSSGRAYFAEGHYAAGVLEGLEHYGLT